MTRPKPPPAPTADERVMPTAERGQHDRLEYGEIIVFSELGTRGTSKAMATRVTTQRVIDRMRVEGKITERQHQAAERFWRFYHASGMEAGRAVDYNRTGGGSGGPAYALTERAASARQDWNRALRAVPQRVSGVFVWVVCDDWPIWQWIAKRGVKAGGSQQRKAREDLHEALDAVADFWKLAKDGTDAV